MSVLPGFVRRPLYARGQGHEVLLSLGRCRRGHAKRPVRHPDRRAGRRNSARRLRSLSRRSRAPRCSRREEIDVTIQSKEKIIRALFAAYLSDNRKAVEDCFADDFRFTSPYDDRIDKATYFERCWRVSDWIERQELEKIFVQGDEAFVTYECVAKGGKNFRNTEFFAFAGDQIKRIDVYFGATYQ